MFGECRLPLLFTAPESQIQLCFAAVCQVSDAPSEPQAPVWTKARFSVVVVTATKERITSDRFNLRGVCSDLISGYGGSRTQDETATNPLGVAHHPLQHAHPTK